MLIIITIYNPLFQSVFYSMKHFDSFLNFVATLRIKLYHSINRIILNIVRFLGQMYKYLERSHG